MGSVWIVTGDCGDYYCGSCGPGHLLAICDTEDHAYAAKASYSGGNVYLDIAVEEKPLNAPLEPLRRPVAARPAPGAEPRLSLSTAGEFLRDTVSKDALTPRPPMILLEELGGGIYRDPPGGKVVIPLAEKRDDGQAE